MTTQPQSPVAVTPPLPTRRNAELALLCFATLITTVALLIVEANQEQGIRWDLVSYTLAFLTLFVCAHLAIRRFAPYADPLLLPVVALLNGLGLVMIHRLDLVEGSLNATTKGPNDEQQMLWTLLGVVGFSLVIIFLKDHRILARYGYICGLTGLVLLAIPALLPARFNTFTAPEHREATRALNAVAISPALRAAPDLLSERLGETCRLAIRHWDRVLEAWYSGPLTLVHGDSHLGNCFEHPAENGPRVGMIDFQAVHWSKGMRDVQYFLINSMEPDVLEKHEAELIDGYLEELARHGVRLGREEAFEQYRAFSFQTLMVGVVPLGLGSLTERDETVRAVTRRSAYAVERLGFREWLDQITSSRTSVSTASSSRPSHSA